MRNVKRKSTSLFIYIFYFYRLKNILTWDLLRDLLSLGLLMILFMNDCALLVGELCCLVGEEGDVACALGKVGWEDEVLEEFFDAEKSMHPASHCCLSQHVCDLWEVAESQLSCVALSFKEKALDEQTMSLLRQWVIRDPDTLFPLLLTGNLATLASFLSVDDFALCDLEV